jgi:hypothetical protein
MKFALCLFLVSCSNLIIRDISEQKFQLQTYGIQTNFLASKDSDYKLRKKSKKETHFSFSEIQFPPNFPELSRALFKEELHYFWSSKLHKEFQNNGSKDFFREKEIDALIETKISVNTNGFLIQQIVKDPITQYIFGELEFPIEFQKSEKKYPAILYKKENKINPLTQRNFESFGKINFPPVEKKDEILNRSKMQEVEISSSSAETFFSLNGKLIGKLPITSYFIQEGEHIFGFEKLGFPKVEKKISIRSGAKKKFYHEWNDELYNSNLRIISSPTKQNILIDKNQFGKTELIQNNFKPEYHTIEIFYSDSKKKISEIRYKFEPKMNISIFAPINFEDSFNLKSNLLWEETLPLENFISDESLLFFKSGELISNLIFPMNSEINSAFFLASDLGQNEVSFKLFNEIDFLKIIAKGDSISFFSNSFIQKKIYSFKTVDAKGTRPFKIIFNRQKSILQLYFDEEKVFERGWDFSRLYKIQILTHSETDSKISALKYLKFQYLDEK